MKIGIDLGGSHIGIGIVNEEGKIIEKSETDIDMSFTANFIENYILNEVKKILEKYEIEAIGVASPGTPKNGKITAMVNLGIKELDITSILKKVFSGLIQVRNDAKCAGIAEKTYGSLKQYQDAVFLCLGTGIGGSCFMQGKALSPNRNPGFEIGHMIIQKDGNLCNCGKKGCFETYCSMKKLKNQLIEAMGLEKNTQAKELLNILKQRQNEEKVQLILKQYIQNLNIGLSNITDILEPEAICLGGGFVYFEDVLYKILVEEYYRKRYVFNSQNMPELKLATLGNDAGIIGATISCNI